MTGDGPPPPPAAVLLDNDGLLLDTESVWTRAEQQLFARRGLEFTLAHKRELVGMPAGSPVRSWLADWRSRRPPWR